MEFTIFVTPKGVVLSIFAILAAILIIYLILFVRKLIKTLSKVGLLLDDSKVVTEVVAKRSKTIDGVVDDVVEVVGIFTDGVKGNQNIAKAASSVVNTVTSVAGIVKKAKDGDSEEE